MNFNYKRAWYELAAPALLNLSPNILSLFLRTHEETRNLQQNADLSLDWPNQNLKNSFDEADSTELSCAARVIYSVGHWYPGEKNFLKPLMSTGSYWRFSTLADQSLRERLKELNFHQNFFFEVHEGFLRAIMSTPNSWNCMEIGLATEDTFNRAKEFIPEMKPSHDRSWDGFEGEAISKINQMKENLVPEGSMADFFHTEKFYED